MAKPKISPKVGARSTIDSEITLMRETLDRDDFLDFLQELKDSIEEIEMEVEDESAG